MKFRRVQDIEKCFIYAFWSGTFLYFQTQLNTIVDMSIPHAQKMPLTIIHSVLTFSNGVVGNGILHFISLRIFFLLEIWERIWRPGFCRGLIIGGNKTRSVRGKSCPGSWWLPESIQSILLQRAAFFFYEGVDNSIFLIIKDWTQIDM